MVLPLFCAALLVCLLLFLLHGRRQGLSRRELLSTALEGVRAVRNILLTFLVIGVMTALWRMAGTIPVLVCYASRLIRPEIFLLMCFLLNCLLSLLTGTSFGTTATMFDNYASGKFRPAAGSPLIDAGKSEVVNPLPSVDIAGDPRLFRNGYDIGCYEWQGVEATVMVFR